VSNTSTGEIYCFPTVVAASEGFFYRNIDNLPKRIPREVIQQLKTFPTLSGHEEIEEWRNFCRNSQYKEVVGNNFFFTLS
jgi:hypothetical protein